MGDGGCPADSRGRPGHNRHFVLKLVHDRSPFGCPLLLLILPPMWNRQRRRASLLRCPHRPPGGNAKRGGPGAGESSHWRQEFPAAPPPPQSTDPQHPEKRNTHRSPRATPSTTAISACAH